jgi:hypothetical protein
VTLTNLNASAAPAPKNALDGERSRLIEHYFRFVLRDEGGPLRERLHRGLVEFALKTGNPEHAMTERDVQARIEQFAHLSDYPISLVSRGLNQLIQRGDVKVARSAKSGQRLYNLASARFSVVEQALSKTDDQDRAFRETVVARLEKKHGRLPREDRELVATSFARFVGQMLESLGERCAHRLIKERSGKALTYPRIQDDLDLAVRGLPAPLQEDACAAFEDALRHPTDDEAAYLFLAGQVYYVAELLNLDPSLQNLQRVRFERTTLFLDTNLLLPLVHPHDDAHGPVRRMISLCHSVGFRIVYADRTAEEFDALITAADKEFARTPPFDVANAAALAEVVENPILRGWLESFQDHNASWSQYRARIAAWRNVLEQDEIEIYCLPSSSNGTRLQKLKAEYSKVRRSRNGEIRDPKKPLALEHDSCLVAAVEDLAAETSEDEPDPFGSLFWVLTRDRHLAEGARIAAGSPAKSNVMLADEWVQYISPFLGANTSSMDPAATFAGLLSSRFIPSLTTRMTLADLRLFADPSVAKLTAGLSEAEACRAVSEAHRQAVARNPSGDRDDQAAIERLAALAEKKLQKQVKQGDLVDATRLEQLRRERREDEKQHAEEEAAKELEIRALRDELQATKHDQRTSIEFWSRKARNLAQAQSYAFGKWTRQHPLRFCLVLISITLALVLVLTGIGGLIVQMAGVASIPISILASDFEKLGQNWNRFIDKGP